MRIDLNADIGEASGRGQASSDGALVQIVTSANIACGFHAGDPSSISETIRLAASRGVAIGAHPGFRDASGFGRREIDATPDEIRALVLYQLGAFDALARAHGVTPRHVKPHGALYNMAARRRDVAEAVATAVASFDESLCLVGLAGSESMVAAARAHLRCAAEGFADRSYEPDGTLTPRTQPGAVIRDPARTADRAVKMVKEGRIEARDGSTLAVQIDTICVHGDTPDAEKVAAAVRAALEQAGVTVAALAAA
jgi:UPF0271 protein